MNYDNMTDTEINKSVAKCLGRLLTPPEGFEVVTIGNVLSYYDDQRVIWQCHFDYVGSPEESWELMIDNNISLHKDAELQVYTAFLATENGYTSFGFGENRQHIDIKCNISVPDESPSRAVCICYLMMQEGK
jgi:hypothetical protein